MFRLREIQQNKWVIEKRSLWVWWRWDEEVYITPNKAKLAIEQHREKMKQKKNFIQKIIS